MRSRNWCRDISNSQKLSEAWILSRLQSIMKFHRPVRVHNNVISAVLGCNFYTLWNDFWLGLETEILHWENSFTVKCPVLVRFKDIFIFHINFVSYLCYRRQLKKYYTRILRNYFLKDLDHGQSIFHGNSNRTEFPVEVSVVLVRVHCIWAYFLVTFLIQNI